MKSSKNLAESIMKAGASSKDARLSRLSELSAAGSEDSDASEFEKKLRDAVWRQRNGLEDPVELAQLKDEALSLSRRYDDSIAKGNNESSLNDYERVLFHQKCSDAVLGELSDQVHVFSPEHSDLLLKTRARYNHLFLTLKKAYGDVHAELAATRKELQSLLAGKERIEKEAVETVANAEKAMRAELEEAEREMGEEKDLLLRQLRDMKAEKEKVDSTLKALHGVFMSMRREKTVQEFAKLREDHEKLKAEYDHVREELKKTRTELSRFISEDITFSEKSCQTDYYLMRGSKSLRAAKEPPKGDEKSERKNLIQAAASSSANNASKELHASFIDEGEIDATGQPFQSLRELFGAEMDASLATFEEAAGDSIGPSSSVEDRSKIFRIIREFFSDKAKHDAYCEYTGKKSMRPLDYLVMFCRHHIDGAGKDPASRFGRPFFPHLSEYISVLKTDKNEYTMRCTIGLCAFLQRRCHVWGDMFPEAQLFVEMTNGGMTADESKFFLRAWLLCAGPDSGWVKSFNSAETTGQTQMPHRFGDGSLAVEANALRCYRAAQLLFRRASSERLKEVKESLRRKFQSSLKATAHLLLAMQVLRSKVGKQKRKQKQTTEEVDESESYSFEDSLKDSSVSVVEFLGTLLACYKREKRRIITNAHERVNAILLDKASKGRGTVRKKGKRSTASVDTRSLHSFGGSEDEEGLDDDGNGEEEIVVGLSFSEFCSVLQEHVCPAIPHDRIVEVYRKAVELGCGVVSFKAFSAVIESEELVVHRLLSEASHDRGFRVAVSVPEETPFPLGGESATLPSELATFLSDDEAENFGLVLRSHWLSYRRLFLNVIDQLKNSGSAFCDERLRQLQSLEAAVELDLSETRRSAPTTPFESADGATSFESLSTVDSTTPAPALSALSRLLRLLLETISFFIFEIESGRELSFSAADASVSYLCEWCSILHGWLLSGELQSTAAEKEEGRRSQKSNC